ncbi:MAG: hypothetical protein GY761_09940 [Hyphomicrobiales bacterium]|nr:hypothetical protein [Hyphomicrobiales bacterium]
MLKPEFLIIRIKYTQDTRLGRDNFCFPHACQQVTGVSLAIVALGGNAHLAECCIAEHFFCSRLFGLAPGLGEGGAQAPVAFRS